MGRENHHREGDAVRCPKCGKDVTVLINDRCCHCNPFRACPACKTGTLESKSTPNWMNRWVCDNCGKAVSR